MYQATIKMLLFLPTPVCVPWEGRACLESPCRKCHSSEAAVFPTWLMEVPVTEDFWQTSWHIYKRCKTGREETEA